MTSGGENYRWSVGWCAWPVMLAYVDCIDRVPRTHITCGLLNADLSGQEAAPAPIPNAQARTKGFCGGGAHAITCSYAALRLLITATQAIRLQPTGSGTSQQRGL
jgi:hypothetical protein